MNSLSVMKICNVVFVMLNLLKLEKHRKCETDISKRSHSRSIYLIYLFQMFMDILYVNVKRYFIKRMKNMLPRRVSMFSLSFIRMSFITNFVFLLFASLINV